MPNLIHAPYREYEFTEDEIVIAASFTDMQVAYLETQLARAVQERANLSPDPSSDNYKELFMMEMEHLRGQIETYQFLLSTSEDLRSRQNLLLQQQADRQNQE